jgi:hypothetical protein
LADSAAAEDDLPNLRLAIANTQLERGHFFLDRQRGERVHSCQCHFLPCCPVLDQLLSG